MLLENDVLKVFFDEKRGGMPTKDSFGFLRAASIEIARSFPFPYFQSLNDDKPEIKKFSDSHLVASGIMRKGKEITPDTYEMTAMLKENKLSLTYKLNVIKSGDVMFSKIWLFTNPLLSECMMSGKVLSDVRSASDLTWEMLYQGRQPEVPIIFFGRGGKLKVLGSTIPSVYTSIMRFKRYPKLEVTYAWASGLLLKGTYSGNLTLVYEHRTPRDSERDNKKAFKPREGNLI